MSLRFRINLLITVLTALFTAALINVMVQDARRSIREEMEGSNRATLQLLSTVIRDAQLIASEGHGSASLLSFLKDLGRVRAHDIRLFDVDDRLSLHLAAVRLQGRPRRAGMVRRAGPAGHAAHQPSRGRRERDGDRGCVALDRGRLGRPQAPRPADPGVRRRRERGRVLLHRSRAAAGLHGSRGTETHGARRLECACRVSLRVR